MSSSWSLIMGELLDRAALHAELDRLLDARDALALREGWRAKLLLGDFAEFVHRAAGQTIVSAALQDDAADMDSPAQDWRTDEDCRRHVVTVAEVALTVAARLVGHDQGGATLDVRDELRAMLGGDAPRLLAPFPGAQGRPTNAYALATTQLRALEWAKALEERGDNAAMRQVKISNAFGHPWDTIRKWDRPCKRELGDGYVRFALKRAARPGVTFPLEAEQGEAAALQWDGRRYKLEKGYAG
ncbi:MAG: hypothetical protein EON59_10250 [Alphaproteobacteria bacterium]|nr:MAG: hypothetical protein EON59_10250 [Alphaproteobacteria bacterium]